MKKRIVSVLLVLSLLAVLTVSVAQGGLVSVDETMGMGLGWRACIEMLSNIGC